jgi:transcriptional regulator with XRE-family HTH domain
MKELSSEHQTEVGGRIRRARKATGQTQAQLARKLDVPTADLARIEMGRMNIEPDFLDGLSRELGVNPQWLATGRGPAPDMHVKGQLSGAQIRHLRETLGMSREELAQRIGIKPSTLHNVELDHQRLGPAATCSLKSLADPENAQLTGEQQNALCIKLVDEAVLETCRILSDESAMLAIRSLSETLGDESTEIIRSLVRRKIMKESNP